MFLQGKVACGFQLTFWICRPLYSQNGSRFHCVILPSLSLTIHHCRITKRVANHPFPLFCYRTRHTQIAEVLVCHQIGRSKGLRKRKAAKMMTYGTKWTLLRPVVKGNAFKKVRASWNEVIYLQTPPLFFIPTLQVTLSPPKGLITLGCQWWPEFR